jgi:hypothetical protein
MGTSNPHLVVNLDRIDVNNNHLFINTSSVTVQPTLTCKNNKGRHPPDLMEKIGLQCRVFPSCIIIGCNESNDGEVLVNACLITKRVQMSKPYRA